MIVPESLVGTFVLLHELSLSCLSAGPALDCGAVSASSLLAALPPPRGVILTAYPFRALSYWVLQLFLQIVTLLFMCSFHFFIPHARAQDPFLVSLDFSFPLSYPLLKEAY